MHNINTGEWEQRLRRALVLKGPAVFKNPGEISGYVCLEDLSVPPYRTDPIGWHGGPSIVAVNIATIGVRNPTGSRSLVVVDSVSVGVSLACPLSFILDANSAATDAGVSTIVQNTDFPVFPLTALSAPVAIQSDLGALVGTTVGIWRQVANTTFQFRRMNIVLPPGTQLLVASGVAANTIQGVFQGRTFLEPPQ